MPSVDKYRESDEFVSSLRSALIRGEAGLANVPGLLKRIIKEDMWQERVVSQTGELVHFNSFREFVETKPLEGLGASIDLIKRICGDDLETLDLIDKATALPHGTNRFTNPKVDNDNIIIYEPEKAEQGTSKEYALRTLREKRPDLHEKVIAGEKSPHAAMVEAGFRKKSLTVPLDPEPAARTILKNFTREQLTVLLEVILKELHKDDLPF